MKQVILGTAGHIDHGKTTLVKALTGTDTDRLPEEKARGITIDLGFAHLRLGDFDIGIVDVPGHEGLIRNMLAGATGFDAVLLAIAADEGVMPQTREHVAIARLLGVQQMVVALTKVDAVEPEWLDLVIGEVTDFVHAEFGDATVVPVSTVTGHGLASLQDALVGSLGHAVDRQREDLFRMPIDRVFTVHGTGTVVTGTVWSGRASRQEQLRILPGLHNARVRGVQLHGTAAEHASAGERAAFALAGVEREQIRRGDVLTGPGWSPTHVLTARVQMLPGQSLAPRQRVRVHLGTAEVLARVITLRETWVQLRLESAIVARAGDRFVIRSYSPVATIGGGRIAEIDRPRKRLTDPEATLLETLLDGSAPQRIRADLELAGEAGRRTGELPVTAGVTPAEVARLATSLPADIAPFGDILFVGAFVEAAIARLCADVEAHHTRFPLEPGIERAVLLARHASPLHEHALGRAEQLGRLVSRGSHVVRAGFEASFPPAQQLLRNRLREQLRAAGLMPPTVSELTALHRSNDVRAVLRLMEGQGEVTAINGDLYVDREVLRDALGAVRSQLVAKALPAGEFKAALPVSRKYLIPLLEYMDRVGVTKREGDLRRVIPVEPTETA